MKSLRRFFSFIQRYSSIVLGLLMLAVLAGGGYLAFKSSDLFAINAIPLEWKSRLDSGRMELEIAREIEAGIGSTFADVLGKRPWEIDLKKLDESIRSLPWIMESRIQRVFPDRLVVSILPKRPLAVIVPLNWEKAMGLRPLSYDGELMPQWMSEVIPDVPFLRGDVFLKDSALRNKAVQLIRALPAEGVLARSNIAEIGWNSNGSKSPGFTILLLSPRTEIRLGESDIETKLNRVAHVLNYLSTQGKRAPVIDSTSVKKVVVRAHHRP